MIPLRTGTGSRSATRRLIGPVIRFLPLQVGARLPARPGIPSRAANNSRRRLKDSVVGPVNERHSAVFSRPRLVRRTSRLRRLRRRESV